MSTYKSNMGYLSLDKSFDSSNATGLVDPSTKEIPSGLDKDRASALIELIYTRIQNGFRKLYTRDTELQQYSKSSIIEVINKGAGFNMEGFPVLYQHGITPAPSKVGAEIFNDYKERVYDESTKLAEEGNIAYGEYSHAEGKATSALDICTHAEGFKTIAKASYSHVEGEGCETSGGYSHAEGYYCKTYSGVSHAEGFRNETRGYAAHAEGSGNNASGNYSHVEGWMNTSSGISSHAEGYQTMASGLRSHSEGNGSKAIGDYSHAEGEFTVANGYGSHTMGYHTKADGAYQMISGKCNKLSTDETDRFIIGNGISDDNRSNCLRVNDDGVYSSGNFNAPGADYAEYFEWADGNINDEDRVGRFVTISEDSDKIRFATESDNFIIGITSANPSVVGDSHDDVWSEMYLKDIFNRYITEEVEVSEVIDEYDDEEHPGQVIKHIIPAHIETRRIINPEYDPSKKYIPRSRRKEWSTVGLVGKLIMIDDGSCNIGRFCKSTKYGIATLSNERTRFFVLQRIDNNHIKVLITL